MGETTVVDEKKGPKSPGFLGSKKNKKDVVDSVPTPKTVSGDDDSSVGSSVSGGGKTKKKPRAEYQKQIDALKEEKGLLKEEKKTYKQTFTILKNWAMNPPLPGSGSVEKTLDFDAVEVAVEEVSDPEEPAVSENPEKSRGYFRKKPRAEYQAEIDALLMDTNQLKEEINSIKCDMEAIKEWSKKCPI